MGLESMLRLRAAGCVDDGLVRRTHWCLGGDYRCDVWLKLVALKDISYMLVTLRTSQVAMFWSNALFMETSTSTSPPQGARRLGEAAALAAPVAAATAA